MNEYMPFSSAMEWTVPLYCTIFASNWTLTSNISLFRFFHSTFVFLSKKYLFITSSGLTDAFSDIEWLFSTEKYERNFMNFTKESNIFFSLMPKRLRGQFFNSMYFENLDKSFARRNYEIESPYVSYSATHSELSMSFGFLQIYVRSRLNLFPGLIHFFKCSVSPYDLLKKEISFNYLNSISKVPVKFDFEQSSFYISIKIEQKISEISVKKCSIQGNFSSSYFPTNGFVFSALSNENSIVNVGGFRFKSKKSYEIVSSCFYERDQEIIMQYVEIIALWPQYYTPQSVRITNSIFLNDFATPLDDSGRNSDSNCNNRGESSQNRKNTFVFDLKLIKSLKIYSTVGTILIRNLGGLPDFELILSEGSTIHLYNDSIQFHQVKLASTAEDEVLYITVDDIRTAECFSQSKRETMV